MADRGMIRNETLTPQDSLAANGRSFHWASRFLGARMGRNAAQLYAFCRLLDDMADDDIPDGPARLACIKADLEAGGTGDDPAFAAFRPFMIEVDFLAVLTALIEGLLQDQADEVCLDDEAALLRYAYRVAGTVGLLMCDVLDCRCQRQGTCHRSWHRYAADQHRPRCSGRYPDGSALSAWRVGQ